MLAFVDVIVFKTVATSRRTYTTNQNNVYYQIHVIRNVQDPKVPLVSLNKFFISIQKIFMRYRFNRIKTRNYRQKLSC